MSGEALKFPLDCFAWESKDQKEGYLAFLKWAKDRGLSEKVEPVDLFFIQKDSDATKWLIRTFGEQVSSLQDQIMKLQCEVAELRSLVVQKTNEPAYSGTEDYD